MARFTLTPSARTSDTFALTTSPLQVGITRDSTATYGKTKIHVLGGDGETPEVFDALAGCEMSEMKTDSFNLKPGNYKFYLADYSEDDSVELIIT